MAELILFLNLVIYLIEKYYDRQTAIFVPKCSRLKWTGKVSQHLTFTGQKLHGDEMVKQAQAYAEK